MPSRQQRPRCPSLRKGESAEPLRSWPVWAPPFVSYTCSSPWSRCACTCTAVARTSTAGCPSPAPSFQSHLPCPTSTTRLKWLTCRHLLQARYILLPAFEVRKRLARHPSAVLHVPAQGRAARLQRAYLDCIRRLRTQRHY